MCKRGDIEWHAKADDPTVHITNRCHTCQKNLSNHKDVLRLSWGEGNLEGEIVGWPGDVSFRYFCSTNCLIDNFSMRQVYKP